MAIAVAGRAPCLIPYPDLRCELLGSGRDSI
jgi:hypothetical protein